jgi:tRNA U34 5-methylaminomethyl-2-thiouridine-forming methyltransferase MnmC
MIPIHHTIRRVPAELVRPFPEGRAPASPHSFLRGHPVPPLTSLNPEPGTAGYRIVRLASGAYSVHSLAHAETFHPVIGPVAEARALYVLQLHLAERLHHHAGEFVIWDVGLGAAANALTVLRAAREVPAAILLLSFDHTLEPLEFALRHPQYLQYLSGYEPQLRALLTHPPARFQDGLCAVQWHLHRGDFPILLTDPSASALAKPHLIMFDAFSPAKNPSMWTLPLFANLFRLLDPARPCVLPTYSRSTMLRVTLLLAGFFVGVGHATGEKEETTVAANTRELIDEPLDRRWLQRAQRSTSAEPLREPIYRQARLSHETWTQLRAHPQFVV